MPTKQASPHIPYDIYESPQEIVIIMPLSGVKKDSLKLRIKNYRLEISAERKWFVLKNNLIPLKQQCYRWPIVQIIDLPSQVYFDKIHSKLTTENVLEIVVPKNIVPDQIALEVEYDS